MPWLIITLSLLAACALIFAWICQATLKRDDQLVEESTDWRWPDRRQSTNGRRNYERLRDDAAREEWTR